MIEAHEGPWAAVIPGFGNANPDSAVSWAAFLCDYGEWLSSLAPRELTRIPPHNTAYKRSALLDLGPRLDTLLTIGDELVVKLRAAGGRFAFDPAARIDHTNLSFLRPWLLERYAGGVLVAHHRMAVWSWRRRLVYALGSPLIPLVLLWRIRHGVAAARRAARRRSPPTRGSRSACSCAGWASSSGTSELLPDRRAAHDAVRDPQAPPRPGPMTARPGIALVGCGRIVCDNHLPALRRISGAGVVALAARTRRRGPEDRFSPRPPWFTIAPRRSSTIRASTRS